MEKIRLGMKAFKRGEVDASLRFFDEAIAEDKAVSRHSWQRGLSLFYVERYTSAMKHNHFYFSSSSGLQTRVHSFVWMQS
jgi:lipoprotein NlpI